MRDDDYTDTSDVRDNMRDLRDSIARQTAMSRDELLHALLETAWPSREGQNQ